MMNNFLCSTPWALLPAAGAELMAACAQKTVQSDLSFLAKSSLSTQGEQGGIALLPIRGVILPYTSPWPTLLGATCLDALSEDFAKACENPDVAAVVLAIDSPGGMITGVHAFSQQVFAARQKKPILAWVSGLAASAAYWIAAAAHQVWVDPTASLGSIGVVMSYRDNAEAQKKAGVRTLEIVSSQSPYKRLDVGTEDGQQQLQSQVDALASVFIDAVAHYRGVTTDTVLSDFGQGGLLVGEATVKKGLADKLIPLPPYLTTEFLNSSSSFSSTTGVLPMKNTLSEASTVTLLQNEPPPPFIAGPAQAAQHENLVSTASEQNYQQGFEAGLALGKTQERARIQSIEAQSLPGHEALIQTLKWDGISTGPEAALKILAAEKTERHQAAVARQEEVPGALPPVLEVTSSTLPLEAQCEAEWQTSQVLREEFYSLEAYTAYRQAEAKGYIKSSVK